VKAFLAVVVRNFRWKLVSLALATVIWISVKAISSEHGQTERMYLNVPIQLVSGTADVRTFDYEPRHVRVTLKGTPDTIKRLNEREIHVLADLTAADASHPFRQRLDVAVPSGFAVIRVEPAEISVAPPPRPEPKIIISTNK
jgi:YbbR domain-containing protein